MLERIAHVHSFVDRSCAGAWAANVTLLPENGPFGSIPPQIRGVTKTTNLVTISIGGNDLNGGAIAERCQVPLPGGDARCRFNTGHIAAAHRMLAYMEGQVDGVMRGEGGTQRPHRPRRPRWSGRQTGMLAVRPRLRRRRRLDE
ncbi:hypothetical protein QNM97_25400 [Gordonia sp. L191]|uniref:hypothetical protein n=1 Tax=Gordonia sp. L191 TaxID=2982699 RepID=UPI0024C002E6|nr:hypothetical protein [Gordonia sp. L191]WHU47237.1 hypothetical protein QNM97_25400 [Gordonia sp. L191]